MKPQWQQGVGAVEGAVATAAGAAAGAAAAAAAAAVAAASAALPCNNQLPFSRFFCVHFSPLQCIC